MPFPVASLIDAALWRWVCVLQVHEVLHSRGGQQGCGGGHRDGGNGQARHQGDRLVDATGDDRREEGQQQRESEKYLGWVKAVQPFNPLLARQHSSGAGSRDVMARAFARGVCMASLTVSREKTLKFLCSCLLPEGRIWLLLFRKNKKGKRTKLISCSGWFSVFLLTIWCLRVWQRRILPLQVSRSA